MLFTPGDINRIVASTFVAEVEHHRTVGSTNDRALELCRAAADRLPLLVVSDEQTAGRGRGQNPWWSSHGALTFSLLLDATAFDLSPADWPKASLAAGLAVCEAIDRLLGNRRLDLKWPNDVLVDRRKLCGILSEVPPQSRGRLVMGIGVNMNNRLAHARPEVAAQATSMVELAGHEFSPGDVLVALLDELAEKLAWISQRHEELEQRWKARCVLTGRNVRLELPGRCLSGTCRGIDRNGALLVETAGGLQRCLSGVVAGWE